MHSPDAKPTTERDRPHFLPLKSHDTIHGSEHERALAGETHRMTTILRDHGPMMAAGEQTCRAKQQVVILRRRASGLEAAKLFQHHPPKHDRNRVRNMVHPQQLLIVICLKQRPARRIQRMTHLTQCDRYRPPRSPLRVHRKTGEVRLDSVRRQPIIGIKENHILALAGTETGIARSGQSLVFLLHTLHRRVMPNHLENVIRRTVVNDNDFSLTNASARRRSRELQAENLPACNRG